MHPSIYVIWYLVFVWLLIRWLTRLLKWNTASVETKDNESLEEEKVILPHSIKKLWRKRYWLIQLKRLWAWFIIPLIWVPLVYSFIMSWSYHKIDKEFETIIFWLHQWYIYVSWILTLFSMWWDTEEFEYYDYILRWWIPKLMLWLMIFLLACFWLLKS